MTTATVSATSRNIMTALVAGAALSKDVATSLNVKTVVVTGSLAGLKKNGYVEVQADGKLALTVAGMQFISPAAATPAPAAPGVTVVSTTINRKGAMKAAAAAIVTRLGATASRKDIVAAFKAELAMSDAQASTYHYNLCGANGMWKA
jgi:hypothetical protein